MGVVRLDLVEIALDVAEALQADLHLPGHFRRLQVVVDQAPQLVFDLGWRQAVLTLQRCVDPLFFGFDLPGIQR
ncbi:hypothetical protein D3C75_588630 [compost metagenome]